MSCCVENAQIATVIQAVSPDEMQVASRALGDGLRQLDLSVPGVHCGLCIKTIEDTLGKISGVAYVRVNLTARRVTIRWKDGETPPDVVDPLRRLGYEAHIFDMVQDKDPTFTRLLIALGVAAFASSNVMLLSVAVWSGADAATRDMFHWISGLIALPTLIYSGRIFYVSAWNALRTRRVNMDVPIALAISLAFGMSVYETMNHGQHAYFDASVSLLFFLLIGRTLDYLMRARARSAVRGLAQLSPRGAVVIGDNDERNYLPVNEIRIGQRIILAAGERVPVDAKVEDGRSELDCAIASGESDAVPVGPGSDIRAGTMNLSAPLVIRATAEAKDSFLAEMVRLMDVAEGGRAFYRRLADRASELYVPMVHTIAFAAFVGWMIYTGGDWYRSIYIAICTLIITCPCALALAVPIVQVVAARRLFENGIMIKDGSAMERMAEIDTAVFDKTGTLTLGQARLIDLDAINPNNLEIASELSLYSRHPLSRALALFSGAKPMTAFTRIEEIPGAGIEAELNGTIYRLGKREWADSDANAAASDGPETCLSIDGKLVQTFRFEDQPREDAASAIGALKRNGLKLEIISGDKLPAVKKLAGYLGVDTYRGEVLPADKSQLVQELTSNGRKVLMVGDGLNDAPALVAAHVSMAPATAADIGRNAADFVFLRESLAAVPLAFAVSKEAGRLISQNFALSIGYNIIAVPIAIFGYVTPLVAALSMSLSSIVVVSNAMRLRAGKQKQQAQTTVAPAVVLKEAHK
ncbi:copper-exporting P-type ATPase [Brucella sp. NBRC 12952]|uniref:Cadmium-translocating P-type ATPase n=1 Tax=Brucella pseudogrignonensis TaxID=419475 RepID=A0A256GKA1_9HYPH|nr:cation-translocating P-type ATPase [Brucella pseudogrignonensis]EMG55002.1 copper-translocating P-type ATPase [Ochrobactrum sp. CDB2]NNV21014.1 cadmium-translocating P-type ATPase [Brucella pseudogrignonensis]OYR27594.1 copper-translocating P-type ATPase [Brucella pseudogrignonensis]